MKGSIHDHFVYEQTGVEEFTAEVKLRGSQSVVLACIPSLVREVSLYACPSVNTLDYGSTDYEFESEAVIASFGSLLSVIVRYS